MITQRMASRFLTWSGAFAAFVAKLNVAGGAAWLILGLVKDAPAQIDHGALSIIIGLVFWPFAAWARGCVRQEEDEDA